MTEEEFFNDVLQGLVAKAKATGCGQCANDNLD